MSPDPLDCPTEVADYAKQAVAYVAGAMEQTLTYDSETLPLLDHYLRSVPVEEKAMVNLAAATAGAYFGEVIRKCLSGSWVDNLGPDPMEWQMRLPGGMCFVPASLTLCCITREDGELIVDAPKRMLPHIHEALDRMGAVSEDAFFSLSSRYDTLEHLQQVLLAVATDAVKPQNDDPERTS